MNRNRLFRLLIITAVIVAGILNQTTLTTYAQSSLAVDIRSNGTDNNQQAAFSFRVRNTGSSAVSGISVRIYFTLDGANAGSNYALEKYWDQSGVATVSSATQSSGSTWYFTVNYGSASLAAGASWEFQTGLHLVNWGTDFNSGNDWFHTGYTVGALPAAFAATANIPAYVNGTRVSGSEPGGSTVPTNTPGTNPTATRGSTTVPTATRVSTQAPTQSTGSQVFQAEQAVLGGGSFVESSNGGFIGSGYVNSPTSGGSIQFNGVSGTGGSVSLTFRYALGVTSSRTGLLIVNGASQSITFQPTGSWTTWSNHSMNVTLNSGTGNTIRLESNGQDLANIDQLTVGAPGTNPTATRTNTPGTGATATRTPTRTATRTPTRTNTPGTNPTTPPVSGWPTPTGQQAVTATINVTGTFDGGMRRYYGSGPLGSGGQNEDQDPLFSLAAGAVLKNVILGAPAADGIHCAGACTLQNVWWEDVGEDAATFRGSSSSIQSLVDGGGARMASDKIFQHNGAGTVTIRNFQAEDFGKLYRSCGNCSTQYQRHVIIQNVTLRDGDSVAGVNTNYGDTARFTAVTIISDPSMAICDRFTGNNSGDEPTKTGSGADGVHCIYSSSDIIYR